MRDQSFDGMAKKFANNIYGTTKGLLRHQLLCDAMDQMLPPGPLKIIELGGGTGVMSAYLANQGHHVTLTDISQDALDLADVPDTVTKRKTDLFHVNDLAQFDVVICHAVLEWLASPQDALSYIAKSMRSRSYLSLTFFNRDAALFSNAVYGNFDYIARGLRVKNQVRLNPQQPLPVSVVTEWIDALGFEIVSSRGIRCFHDYIRDIKAVEDHYDELLALERQYNQHPPYKWLGRYFHYWLQR